MNTKFVFDDGGRTEAGFKGIVRDCVCRSIAIATEMSYIDIYNALNNESQHERHKRKSNARTGVHPSTFHRYLKKLGWDWIPTMQIGTGCKVHLNANELPNGILILKLSKHLTVMKNGIIHDIFDPSREGKRCVYGYWINENSKAP